MRIAMPARNVGAPPAVDPAISRSAERWSASQGEASSARLAPVPSNKTSDKDAAQYRRRGRLDIVQTELGMTFALVNVE